MVDLKRIANLNNFSGNGNQSSPYIFKNYENIPEELRIKNSNLFLVFENCEFNNLYLENCQNMSFINCFFLNNKIYNCKDIIMRNCEIGGVFKINKSQDLVVNNCDIGKLRLIKSHNCLIKKGNIFIATVKFSLGNSFEKTHIEDFNPVELVNGGRKWEIIRLNACIFFILFMIYLFTVQFEPWRYGPIYFIFGSALIFIPIGRGVLALCSNYILKKLTNEFGLNQLILA